MPETFRHQACLDHIWLKPWRSRLECAPTVAQQERSKNLTLVALTSNIPTYLYNTL